MKSTTLLSLAALTLALPAAAADLPWDKAADGWEKAAFEDASGVSRSAYFFQPIFDETKWGDEIKVWVFTPSGADKTYDARQSAFTAKTFKEDGVRGLVFSLDGT